ncbi:MAG: hypothetical protein JXQ96_19010 [Cyclobacteriaceae bacterium]
MKLKWLFLGILLGLPVGIYLFLQGFGNNRFEVPVFYEKGIDTPIGSCQDSKSLFKVPTTIQLDHPILVDQKKLTVFDVGTPNCDSCQFKINNMVSVLDRFRNWEGLTVVSIVNGAEVGLYPDSKKDWQVHTSEDGKKVINFANCVLNLEVSSIDDEVIKNGRVVLVDNQQRIRGYYNVFDRKESDRLAVEIEILRQNMN